jgi:putative phage-type endonuclease
MWQEPEDDYQNQGSPSWHAFRSRHIGASEIAAVMGVDDFRTARDVFKAKTGGEIFKSNFAMERGKELEPIALARFEYNHRCRLSSPTLEYQLWRTLSASLDGLWEEDEAVVEVKAPAKWKHTMALCGLVPETYEDQLQTQMLVTGFQKAYYVSFHPDEPEGFDYAEVIVVANPDRQMEILNRAKHFWSMVEAGVYDESF